jgi:hypothetical protein
MIADRNTTIDPAIVGDARCCRLSEKDSNPEQTAAQVIALALWFSELY